MSKLSSNNPNLSKRRHKLRLNDKSIFLYKNFWPKIYSPSDFIHSRCQVYSNFSPSFSSIDQIARVVKKKDIKKIAKTKTNPKKPATTTPKTPNTQCFGWVFGQKNQECKTLSKRKPTELVRKDLKEHIHIKKKIEINTVFLSLICANKN